MVAVSIAEQGRTRVPSSTSEPANWIDGTSFRFAVFKAVLRKGEFVPVVPQLCEREGHLNEILWFIVSLNKKHDLLVTAELAVADLESARGPVTQVAGKRQEGNKDGMLRVK